MARTAGVRVNLLNRGEQRIQRNQVGGEEAALLRIGVVAKVLDEQLEGVARIQAAVKIDHEIRQKGWQPRQL